MAPPSHAAFVTARPSSNAGVGTAYGDISPFFRDTFPTANCTFHPLPQPSPPGGEGRVRGKTSLQKTIHVRLSDQPAGLIELGAQPAQDRRGIRQLAFLERGHQAGFAASALFGFQDAIAM